LVHKIRQIYQKKKGDFVIGGVTICLGMKLGG